MTPKVQAGTILIEERPPLFISSAAVRTIFLPEHDSITTDIASVPLA